MSRSCVFGRGGWVLLLFLYTALAADFRSDDLRFSSCIFCSSVLIILDGLWNISSSAFFFAWVRSIWHSFFHSSTLWLCSFLAHLAFGQVSFCHHLASVVRRKLSHFNLLPQKPLDQLQPNFGGMVLGWPPSKIVSGDPNQDGRQAKNRKKGGWNFNCPLLL